MRWWSWWMLVSGDCLPFEVWIVLCSLPLLRAELLDNPSIWLTFAFFEGNLIPVEKEDPFTRLGQNFFSFLSHRTERLCDGHHTSTFLLFFPSLLHYSVCVCSTLLLEFPNHPQEFPNLPTPMGNLYFTLLLLYLTHCSKGRFVIKGCLLRQADTSTE